MQHYKNFFSQFLLPGSVHLENQEHLTTLSKELSIKPLQSSHDFYQETFVIYILNFSAYNSIMNQIESILIRETRIKKQWSQESLSHGICSLSYLSKIEKGTIQASQEILDALLKKLDIKILTKEHSKKIDNFYKKNFLFEHESISTLFSEEELQKMEHSLYCLDSFLIQLLLAIQKHDQKKSLYLYDKIQPYVSFMNSQQKNLWYQCAISIRKISSAEFLRQHKDSIGYYIIGIIMFNQGKLTQAILYWNQAYQIASQEGSLENMIYSQIAIGNTFCCLQDLEETLNHYKIAKRLLQQSQISIDCDDLTYNIATLYLEKKNPSKALELLSSIAKKRNDALLHHKLALCYEKLNSKQKALEHINEGLSFHDGYSPLLNIVFYRLTHQNYLDEKDYEELLHSCLEYCEQYLPYGFKITTYPYLLAVYEHQRRYKEAYQLLQKKFLKNHKFY